MFPINDFILIKSGNSLKKITPNILSKQHLSFLFLTAFNKLNKLYLFCILTKKLYCVVYNFDFNASKNENSFLTATGTCAIVN